MALQTDTQKPGEQLIFIISQPRSGSTLLQRLLAGHPDVYTTAEPWIMLHPLYGLKEDGCSAEYNSEWAGEALRDFLQNPGLDEEAYFDAVRQFGWSLYKKALGSPGKKIFLDKTPRYYLILPELIRTFPKARFIILLRNPLAVLASILRNWVRNDWQALSSFKYDLFLAPIKLAEAIERFREKITIVRYEKLVEDPEQVLQHLCDVLNLSFDPKMIEYGRHPAPAGRMGDQVGIGKHDKPVSDGLKKWVLDLASSPQARYLAEFYLAFLTPRTFARLGYSFKQVTTDLHSLAYVGGALNQNEREAVLTNFQTSAYELSFWHIREPRRRGSIGYGAEVEERIVTGLRAAGVEVLDYWVDVQRYRDYFRAARYSEDFSDYYSFNLAEKSLEHFIAADLLQLTDRDIYVDIATENSPVPEIYRWLFGVESYRQDLAFPPGLSGDQIGGDAANMPIPGEFASKMALHCSFEHFEGESDIGFIREASRTLKSGGAVCIVPLYLFDRYAIQTDPEVAVRESVSFEKDVTVFCREGWNNRHARFYDPQQLVARLVANLDDLTMTVFRVRNAKAVDASCYVQFAALLTKPSGKSGKSEKILE